MILPLSGTVGLELTLFCIQNLLLFTCKSCWFGANHVWKAGGSVSKQGQLQPCHHSKAGSLGTELKNGLLPETMTARPTLGRNEKTSPDNGVTCHCHVKFSRFYVVSALQLLSLYFYFGWLDLSPAPRTPAALSFGIHCLQFSLLPKMFKRFQLGGCVNQKNLAGTDRYSK